MHSRQHIPRSRDADVVTRRHSAVARLFRHTALGSALLLTATASARAQRADSARVAVRPVTVDTSTRTVPKPPLSPRRAFLYSALLPGYSQSVLGRTTAGAIFVLSESIAIAMLRESKADLNEARRLRTDTLVVVGVDPVTGVEIKVPSPYTDEIVSIRKGHVEDWVAFLVANHLFAAADAYVAANLWDLPSQISLRQTHSGTVLAARIAW